MSLVLCYLSVVLKLVLSWDHFLSILICLEVMNGLILMGLSGFTMSLMSPFFIFFFLLFMVMEGVLGLVLLISLSRWGELFYLSGISIMTS